jgi:ribosomal protein S18 acetylase RimI-like enzyme
MPSIGIRTSGRIFAAPSFGQAPRRSQPAAGRAPAPSTIRTVFVLPAAQAGGIVVSLIRQVETFARGRQIASLTVPSSITAVNFYRKLGYVALRDEYWRNVRTILMRKDL